MHSYTGLKDSYHVNSGPMGINITNDFNIYSLLYILNLIINLLYNKKIFKKVDIVFSGPDQLKRINSNRINSADWFMIS